MSTGPLRLIEDGERFDGVELLRQVSCSSWACWTPQRKGTRTDVGVDFVRRLPFASVAHLDKPLRRATILCSHTVRLMAEEANVILAVFMYPDLYIPFTRSDCRENLIKFSFKRGVMSIEWLFFVWASRWIVVSGCPGSRRPLQKK